MTRTPILLLALALCCLLASACSSDENNQDAATTTDTAPAGDGTSATDGPAAQDSATTLDSHVKPDGTGNPDAKQGTWSCTLKPGGGTFTNPHTDGCKWEWSCPTEGDRQLYCETVSTASHTCSCKNLQTNTTEKTFTSVDICTYNSQAIAAQANKNCGWSLPVQ